MAPAAHGTLSLPSPWSRQAITADERRDYQARIRDGYTIRLTTRSDRRAYHVEVWEHGATMSGNRVVRERVTYADPRKGLDAAIGWIEDHDTATYAGVAVPVR